MANLGRYQLVLVLNPLITKQVKAYHSPFTDMLVLHILHSNWKSISQSVCLVNYSKSTALNLLSQTVLRSEVFLASVLRLQTREVVSEADCEVLDASFQHVLKGSYSEEVFHRCSKSVA
jgi:hypothetical protein